MDRVVRGMILGGALGAAISFVSPLEVYRGSLIAGGVGLGALLARFVRLPQGPRISPISPARQDDAKEVAD